MKVIQFENDISQAYMVQLSARDTVSVDIETTGLCPFKDCIATIQFSARGLRPAVVRIVDPQHDHIPRWIYDLMSDGNVTKLFHQAVFDLAFMQVAWSVRAKNVACTKILAKLLREGATSLEALTKKYTGVMLNKDPAIRCGDWTKEELSAEQMAYAVNDVLYLEMLYTNLQIDMSGRDKQEMRELFEHIPVRVSLQVHHGIADIYCYPKSVVPGWYGWVDDSEGEGI